MRWALLAALALASSAASAQEVQFSAAISESCVAAQSTPDGKRACLGQSAQRCMEVSPEGYTTIGMMNCMDAERDYWDARLNRAYQSVRARAQASDAELDALGSAAPRTAVALRDMQRAWISYRDATCEFEQSQWGGGSGGGPAILSCLMRLTGEQALYLENAWLGE